MSCNDNIIRLLRAIGLTSALSLASIAVADDFSVIEDQGQIHSLDFGSNSLNISGVSYTVAIDADVEVDGTYGAYTMLQEGMRVEFVYRRFDEKSREITAISELPDSYQLEEY